MNNHDYMLHKKSGTKLFIEVNDNKHPYISNEQIKLKIVSDCSNQKDFDFLDLFQKNDNLRAVMIIDKFLKSYKLELSGNFSWNIEKNGNLTAEPYLIKSREN